MKAPSSVLVFSGHNIRAVIAFCRWADERNVPFHIVAKNDTDPIFLTKYKAFVAVVRESSTLDVHDVCRWVAKIRADKAFESVLILPSTEFLNRFLIHNREALEANGCLVPLVDEVKYRMVSDKQSFGMVCKSFGLDIPAEFQDLPDTFPFVAKPVTYSTPEGRQLVPHLIHTPQDLEAFHATEIVSNYYFQEFVFGRSIYLLAHISKWKEDILFSQENLMQQSKGASIFLARSSYFHDSVTAQHYVKMLHDIGFFGLIMVELKWDEERDRYFMIEANPRLWGPMQFAVDNGVELFRALLEDYGFSMHPSSTDRRSQQRYYFWSGGMTAKAKPYSYHNYSPEDFVSDLHDLQSADIFLREDTFPLFFSELQSGNIE